MNKGNILIIDDDPYILLSVTTLLEQYYSNIRTLKDPSLIPSELNAGSWDIILLDMNFKPGETSGQEGMQWLEKMLKIDPGLNIIIITAYGDIEIAVQAMKKGAVDFLTKPFDDKELLHAVREAIEKDRGAKAKRAEVHDVRRRIDRLTPRELEILRYVITGMPNKQIAFELDIAEKTVKVHRGRIMEKLHVDSVAELVRLAEKAGIKPPD